MTSYNVRIINSVKSHGSTINNLPLGLEFLWDNGPNPSADSTQCSSCCGWKLDHFSENRIGCYPFLGPLGISPQARVRSGRRFDLHQISSSPAVISCFGSEWQLT
ncbi:hypothetical protein AVEN_248130-1 [Araneus ventricosus]|uniref:Uncharacterized protein n=1 Tax=Araneus ventricosus TaxID=182803 RepID=A0A4Y2HWK1_ARAVE|nr:hypothetical protein AVEN_248130-1 [Araneus ventricosus]